MRLSPGRAAGLAFLTAAVTLLLQIFVHRMVSAKLLNNYAFLVISLTMLGFALSGVVLSFKLRSFVERLADAANLCAALLVVSLLVASIAFYHSEAQAHFAVSRPAFVVALFRWMPYALLFALPFAFSGLILGALLAAPDLPARRIYFWDLLGSAVGAFAAIPAIQLLGVEWSSLALCAVFLLGTLLLAPPPSRRVRVVLGVTAAGLLACVLLKDRALDFYYPEGSILAATRDPASGVVLEHAVWDPLARIEVSRIPPPDPRTMFFPSLIGENRAFLARFRRMLTQNNYAFTYAVEYDGERSSLSGIEETIYSAAYQGSSVANPRVAIIGVGGGFDILNALAFDASRVTAIEVNAATVGILTRTYAEYFRHWVRDPRVELVEGEGRHVLAARQERFDVLQLSGVDSYSGTPGAAHVFSENYLYTAEAFDLYLSRLSDQGILNVMRLEFPMPREMLRALVTAVGALRRAGVARPADHVVMVSAPNGTFTALLVKKSPFTEPELGRLAAWADKSPYFDITAAPRRDTGTNLYRTFLELGDPQRERAFVAAYPFDISSTDDDRPFFFKYSFWWHVFPSDYLIWADVPVMEYSLILLLGAIGLAAIVSIYVPLRHFAHQGLQAPAASRWLVYFGGAGLGYLALEVALLQKFGLFLGHPNYALSVVLAALLLATGLGSLFSGTIVRRLGGIRFVSYVFCGIVLAELLLLFPRLPALVGMPFPLRVALVFGLVAPIGLCLGSFVPSALERLKLEAPDFVPWAWGVNGIFSVLAPVLAIAVSISWGISALLVCSLPVYLAVGWSWPGSRSPAPPAPG
jgi:spermidine synthase